MPGKVAIHSIGNSCRHTCLFADCNRTSQLYARDFRRRALILRTTYNRAQVLDWINDTTFAIGRWDGSITIFRTPTNGEYGPVIIQAAAAPSGHGIEMLSAMDGATLVTSDGSDRLALWRKSSADGPLSFIQTTIRPEVWHCKQRDCRDDKRRDSIRFRSRKRLHSDLAPFGEKLA